LTAESVAGEPDAGRPVDYRFVVTISVPDGVVRVRAAPG